MKSLFEEMGGTYRQMGDYFIPNLVLPDDGDDQIGKYGRMRRCYLEEHRKILCTNYAVEGTLFKHLSEIDQACNERTEIIIPAMATVGADLGNGGPGLMFIYLLPVFNGLGAGISRVICLFFYLVVLFAGVSSIINLFETPVAFLQEKLNLKRLPATAVIHVLGVLIALMIQPWTSQWMDMVSIYLCPLGAFTAGVMFFWVMKKDTALEAAQLGDSKPLMKWFYPFGRYVFVPLCLLCFVLGIAMGGIG